MTRRLVLAPLLLAGAVLAGCASGPIAPSAYVVLLENADGSTGKVSYAGPQGTAQLEQPREAVALQGPATTFLLDPAQLQRDAGAALNAQPLPPRSFLLYFDVGTAQMTAVSRALLPEILQEVRARTAPDLSIIGHTDTVGRAELNESLSLRRAQQVGEMLKDARAAAVAVQITSHGESNLLVATPDETDEPRNRRVEVTVR
jgi:peptidoglycan-associated lipoprotein